MHRFKAAVFGTGFVGRVHLEGIRRLGYVQVYAIGESEVEKAARLGAEFQVEKIDSDYRRILEDPAVDAVHICTPNFMHFPMAKDALQAGKHVICEKPLATSVEEARALVALAGQTQRGAGGQHALGHLAAQSFHHFGQFAALAQSLAHSPVAAQGPRAGKHQISHA